MYKEDFKLSDDGRNVECQIKSLAEWHDCWSVLYVFKPKDITKVDEYIRLMNLPENKQKLLNAAPLNGVPDCSTKTTHVQLVQSDVEKVIFTPMELQCGEFAWGLSIDTRFPPARE